ncbi:MAG: transcriptional regulator NrdR [Gammaproteobacteria bacterium]|nr:transcriptional regulator NrdR [Gammaproteobacteria bacterium]MCD8541990.1 transcriptional regulator NrdR [Gammaproteobacteria bacterium]
MHCPFCPQIETKVIDSRLSNEGTQVRRRRECLQCGERFTTFEAVELSMPRIIKNNGERVMFDEQKIRRGMMRALEKRPVNTGNIETAIKRIIRRLRETNDQEVNATFIGELVMAELRQLDQVAFVRFASVYRSFKDINEFKDVVNTLNTEEQY